MGTSTVNFIGSAAPLFSAAILEDCRDAEDPTCKGGVAAVAAYIRKYAFQGSPTLVCPRLDRQHEFVQSHPMEWNVNTKVLNQHFGWPLFTSDIALLTEGEDNNSLHDGLKAVKRNVTGLQTPDIPLLITNAAIPPSNPWHHYVESVHFDPNTNLALISLEDEDADNGLGWSQVESALASLDYVAAENNRRRCGDVSMSALISGAFDSRVPCWIPILMVYKSANTNAFDRLVKAVDHHEYPPALLVDWEGTQKAYAELKVTDNEMWIVSQELISDKYLQYTITVDLVTQRLSDLIVITDNLLDLPVESRDESYANDISFLRSLADEAIEHDPVVGNSNAMPRANTEQCQKGECKVGNLIADSVKWKFNADIAFVLGRAITGTGWSFGQVHVSDIFKALPKPTTTCTGKISGRVLVRVLEHALTAETTSIEGNSTSLSSNFLQVSGLKIVYNNMRQDSTKLVSVKVWNPSEQAYLNVNPLRLYKFATERDLCNSARSSYASIISSDEVRPTEGEDFKVRMDSTLLQNVVGQYFQELESTYVPALEGRLENNVLATAAIHVPSTSAAVCPKGSFWQKEKQACMSCPSSRDHVTLSESTIDFHFPNNTTEPQTGRVVVVNRDLHDFVMITKDIPDWFEFMSATSLSSSKPVSWPYVPLKLSSGERIAFDFAINASRVGVGVTYGTVYFNISDYESIPHCFSQRRALALSTMLRVSPPDMVVNLGHHATVGMALMGVVLSACFGLGIWVFATRRRWGYGNIGDKSIKSTQPLYLGTICLGTFVMSSTIAALSMDEGLISDVSKACVVAPWLLSFGLTLIFSALLSKLATAAKIAEQPHAERAVQISFKDWFLPFAALLLINSTLLFLMLIDPPSWSRQAFETEDWKLYGFCDYGGLSSSLLITSVMVHSLTLFYTLYQTYRVSKLSDELHEIQNIGVALFTWFVISIVSIPVLFTIEEGDIARIYYLRVGVICSLCLSMLLCIFGPVLTRTTARVSVSTGKSKYEVEKMEENQSLFGGFLGFSSLAGGSTRGDIIPEVHDDEDVPQEEQNRCFTDHICY